VIRSLFLNLLLKKTEDKMAAPSFLSVKFYWFEGRRVTAMHHCQNVLPDVVFFIVIAPKGLN